MTLSKAHNKATTLKQVAAEAGVSVQAASHICNGKGQRYSPDTRQRVLAAAKQLQYQANPLSRALLSGRSMSIGLVTGGLTSLLAVRYVQSMINSADSAGYLTYLNAGYHTGDDTEELFRTVRDMIGRRVDGLIMYRGRSVPESICKWLREQSVPTVFLGWAPSGWNARIRIDRQPALDAMVDHLAELGHTRAAFIPSRNAWDFPDMMIRPYARTCKKAGISLQVSKRWCLDPDSECGESARDVVKQFLRANPATTALLMNNDDGAIGAMAAARELGLSVPDDLSIVGHDDLACARLCLPALTTFRIDGHRVGVEAFAMLHTLMKQPKTEVKTITLNVEPVFRQSTGPAPSDYKYLVEPQEQRRVEGTCMAEDDFDVLRQKNQ